LFRFVSCGIQYQQNNILKISDTTDSALNHKEICFGVRKMILKKLDDTLEQVIEDAIDRIDSSKTYRLGRNTSDCRWQHKRDLRPKAQELFQRESGSEDPKESILTEVMITSTTAPLPPSVVTESDPDGDSYSKFNRATKSHNSYNVNLLILMHRPVVSEPQVLVTEAQAALQRQSGIISSKEGIVSRLEDMRAKGDIRLIRNI